MAKPALTTKRRRLFFDIETSPYVGTFWQPGFKKTISFDDIVEDAKIICICYKWEGEKEVCYLHWDKNQDDKKMLESFIKVANQANELVGHNGDRFDLAWIRTRCLYHRIPMFPTYRTIDTLKIARAKFRLPSNKLDSISKYLNIGQKIKVTFGLWKKIKFEKDRKALDKMISYCKKDVIQLQRVFNEFWIHLEPKVHYGVLFGSDRGDCPECGSDDLRRVVRRTTATGLKKIQYQCQTCGKYHTKTDK